MARESKATKTKTNSSDVLLRMNRRSADAIQKLSRETGFSIKSIVDWLTWLGSTSMGRKVKIEEGNRTLEISLKEWHKLKPLDD
jgi:hypothetical protein